MKDIDWLQGRLVRHDLAKSNGDPPVNGFTESSHLCPFSRELCPIAAELAQLKAEVRRLQEETRKDILTGLYNFRFFQEALAAEMERTRRTGLPTGLIIIDLDHFKQINDTYGHEAGNLVLKAAARRWQDQIRQLDMACRYGGEEFAIILPGTRFSKTVQAAERLRAVLAQSEFEVENHRLTLTASFGVDCFTLDESLSIEGFVDRADQWLLQAKREGRNRVCYDENPAAGLATQITEAEKRSLLGKNSQG
jgi:two-component system cell cycle response regulator